MSEFRTRVVAPILVPIAGLLVAGVVVFAFSRVLLAVPKYWSVTLAGLLAAEVLGVAAVLAAVRRVTGTQRALVGLLGAIVLAGGGVGLANGIRPIEVHSEGVAIAATNSIFDVTEVEAPADAPFELIFTNNDNGIPHNVTIFEDTETLFAGEIINGPASITYEVPALPAATYDFRCDVHPDMLGTLTAGEGGGHGGGTEGEGEGLPTAAPGEGEGEHGALTVVSAGSVFDTEELLVEAGAETHITFQNDDAGIPHNIAIYADDTATENLFRGETITGPSSVNYVFTLDAAGEYFFRCDVHPTTMVGAVIAE